MKLEEAIQTAIGYETRVRDVYHEAANRRSWQSLELFLAELFRG